MIFKKKDGLKEAASPKSKITWIASLSKVLQSSVKTVALGLLSLKARAAASSFSTAQ